ncbi:uncharacterized protein V1510DRAFT_407636 [Dipodascopsis tothii]|uniref:uncharacterized protein n=1 Tax=Dipodascopsis tothii TaxID=44089 RepID=UPI0034CDEEF3
MASSIPGAGSRSRSRSRSRSPSAGSPGATDTTDRTSVSGGDSTDDGFMDDSDGDTMAAAVPGQLSAEVRRLQRDHHQQGYIDGITAGRAEAVQDAFDSGYPVGAYLGYVVGDILGVLQGAADEAVQDQARSELLDLDALLAQIAWGREGLRLPAAGALDPAAVRRAIDQHPLVVKWTRVADALAPTL